MHTQNLYDLQERQRVHDEGYHQDILALGTISRTKHLVLHFVKYLANLEDENDETLIKRNIVDFMICTLSMANMFQIDLSKAQFVEENKSVFKNIGRMAKACEALDHLESFPSRDVLVKETKNVYFLLLNLSKKHDVILEEEINKRWLMIEKGNIYDLNDRRVVQKGIG